MLKTSRRALIQGALVAISSLLTSGCSSLRRSTQEKSLRKIAFITDFHYAGEAAHRTAWSRLLLSLERENVDLVIGGGDWITEGALVSRIEARARLEMFATLWKELPYRKTLIMGNHDLVRSEDGFSLSSDLFREIFPEWSSNNRIDFEEGTILTLQSVAPEGSHYRGHVSSEQMEWLKEQIVEISTERPLFLVTHIPFLTSLYQRTKGIGFTPPEDQFITNGPDVLNLFDKHNLKIVLQGHLHVHEEIRWRDTHFITGGAVCGKWWHGAHHGTPPGFRLIEISGQDVGGRYVTIG